MSGLTGRPKPLPPDPRAYASEWREVAEAPQRFNFNPISDPLLSSHLGHWRLGSQAQILFGRVVDALAHDHCYRVAFEGGQAPIPCTMLAHTPLLPFGARELNTLAAGCGVWAIVHAQQPYGLILGVEPEFTGDNSQHLSDYIHQASRCGQRVDTMHGAIETMAHRGGTFDWSAGRPIDSTTAGEWGAMAETGVRVELDSFMAQLAVDEATGVFAFYHDQLLRLAGYNLQCFSASHEEEIFDDEGEVYHYRGRAFYPWEQLGVRVRSTDPFKEYTVEESQLSKAHYATLEPKFDDQAPIHRLLEFYGYLGQGFHRVLGLPKGEEINRYSAPAEMVGLFEEHLSLTGRYTVRSAKGFSFVKRPGIPFPRRRRRPDDAEGDTAANYNASGLPNGNGEEHKVRGELNVPDLTPLDQASRVEDLNAQAFNWENLHGFHYHTNDWVLPEEDESELVTPAGLNFSQLRSQMHLDPPGPVELEVDHRYGKVKYFANESYITALDDGGLVIGDGYGAEIRMSGGSIYITAPGDIVMQPGRSMNVLAGHDINLRARNSVDVSASEKDVRIKAENNLHALAGNSGTGGLLLESRAVSQYDYENKVGEDVVTGGIQLKSKGDLTAWAGNVFLRSLERGQIVLDADQGRGMTIMHANSATRYINSAAADYFGSEGSVRSANLFSQNSNVLGAQTSIEGSLFALGGAQFGSHVSILNGHIGSQQSAQFSGQVGELKELSLAKAQEAAQSVQQSIQEIEQAGRDLYTDLFKEFWYGEKRPGNEATIEAVAFTFRNGAQYRTDNYELWEARWQRLARLTGGASKWTEKKVTAPKAEETYPYPGKKAWVDDEVYRQVQLKLFDPNTGAAVARDPETYVNTELAAAETSAADGNYTLII